VREDVARQVFDRLENDGYDVRLHEPDVEGSPFQISVLGHGFDLADFKTLAKVSEDFGLGLKLDDKGWITLSTPPA
jgi:hypothetical protein